MRFAAALKNMDLGKASAQKQKSPSLMEIETSQDIDPVRFNPYCAFQAEFSRFSVPFEEESGVRSIHSVFCLPIHQVQDISWGLLNDIYSPG